MGGGKADIAISAFTPYSNRVTFGTNRSYVYFENGIFKAHIDIDITSNFSFYSTGNWAFTTWLKLKPSEGTSLYDIRDGSSDGYVTAISLKSVSSGASITLTFDAEILLE